MLNNNTIVQGVDDVDVSYSALADIDYSAFPEAVPVVITVTGAVTIYDFGQLQLMPLGEITHDPDAEVIKSQHNGNTPCVVMPPSCTYRYGVETTGNGNTRYSAGVGFIFTGLDTAIEAEWQMKQYSAIRIDGATFIGRGGGIMSSRGIGIYSATGSRTATGGHATFDVVGTTFTKIGTDARREIRFNNGVGVLGDVRGMVIDGFQVAARALPLVFAVSIVDGELVQLANTAGNSRLTDFDTSDSITETYDLGTDSLGAGGATFFEALNPIVGSALRVMPKSGVGTERQLGGLITTRRAALRVVDEAGVGIDDVQLAMRDDDNGFRKSANGLNMLPDIEYHSASVAGDFPVFDVTTSITNIDSQGPYTNADWDTTALGNRYKVDRRGIGDDATDRFLAHYYHYLYNYSPVPLALLGGGTLSARWTMFLAADVTEPDMAVALAWLVVDSNARAYDRARAFTHGSYNRQVTDIITLAGDAGSHDIDVDLEAAEAFAFDGSTITLRATTFVGDLRTTGEVRLLRGATITGARFDINGDSNLTATVPTGYEHAIDVYTSVLDAESETGEIATGASFRYQSATRGGTTVWFRMTQEDGSYIIENYLVPAAPGNHAVSLVVTSENAALGAIKAVTDRLNTMIEVVGGQQVLTSGALRNTFDPATDTVARVARVDVTTENEDIPEVAESVASIAALSSLIPALL